MWGTPSKINSLVILLTVLQSLAAPLICVFLLFVITQALDVEASTPYFILAIVAAMLCMFFLPPSVYEQSATFTSGWTITTQILFAWGVVVAMLLLLGYAIKISDFYSRRALFAWFLLTPILMVGAILLLRKWSMKILLASGQVRTAVVCGANRASQRLIQSIRERPELGLVFKGLFDDRNAERLGEEFAGHLRGSFADMVPYVRANRIDAIFVAMPLSNLERSATLLTELQDTTASIYYVPDVFIFDLIQSRTLDLNGIPVVALRDSPYVGWQALAKRTCDIVLAALMIVLASPLLLGIALAIRFTSPGSVIFKQRRYGLNGEEIVVYKFRTMTTSEDGSQVTQASRDDPRVTPLGRFLRKYSLDELPQLFNVLQGRMSLVGPRPHAVAHNEAYRRLITGYMVRHKVIPGITGLAQINGCRGETTKVEDMQRRVEYDIQYMRHWSLALDFKILVKTLLVLFRDERAY